MNQSEYNYTSSNVSDLFSVYKRKEEELFQNFLIFYVLATIIILSNSIVVLSSGLILKKGHVCPSFLLLGNLSLADTILGISLLIGLQYIGLPQSSPLCVLFIGLIICPAIVSALTVGLMAVDRYIYIVHGLYYQRWLSSATARGAIIATWSFSIIISFLPVIGWTNEEFCFSICSYMTLFPKELVLFNAALGFLPILIVACLYSIILYKALRTVDKLNTNHKSIRQAKQEYHNDRMNRLPMELETKKNNGAVVNSDSFSDNCANFQENVCSKDDDVNKEVNNCQGQRESSMLSIHTIAASTDDIECLSKSELPCPKSGTSVSNATKTKVINKNPAKFRAVVVVLLTTGSFIVSVLPYNIGLIMFEMCENKLINPRCLQYRALLARPLVLIFFMNSIMNPMIYAWWHRAFQNRVKYYFTKYIRTNFSTR